MAKTFKVDDVIRLPAYSGGFRVWRVVGVHLGAENQEGVVEIETLDRNKNTQGRMFVPYELLDAADGNVVDDTANLEKLADAESERDEILERLKEIGDLVGCNHFNDPDGRLKLVNCVQDCLMDSEQIEYVRRLTKTRNYSDPPVAMTANGHPRRSNITLHSPAEAAIRAAVIAVEETGADVLLTDAVVLLGLAKDKVADFIEKE